MVDVAVAREGALVATHGGAPVAARTRQRRQPRARGARAIIRVEVDVGRPWQAAVVEVMRWEVTTLAVDGGVSGEQRWPLRAPV